MVLALLGGLALAQTAADIGQFKVERVDDEILASAQVGFELPAVVEDALLKGIPMYFTVQADILRERWYWYDKKQVSVGRQLRLAYQPLTRRWRLNVTSGATADSAVGLSLNQSFDTLLQSLSAIKRLSRWRIADTSELDAGVRYKVDLRFYLDLSQLPRPFQIGAIGKSDWDIAAAASTTFQLDSAK